MRGLEHQRGQAERVFLRQFAQAGLGCGAAAERAIEIGMAAEIHVPVRAQARHGQAIGDLPREQLAVQAQRLVVQRLQRLDQLRLHQQRADFAAGFVPRHAPHAPRQAHLLPWRWSPEKWLLMRWRKQVLLPT